MTATAASTASTATVAAAGCQQHGLKTQCVSSCWYVFCSFILFYFIHYTNDYFMSTQDVKTSMAATVAQARDAADVTTGLKT